MIFVSEIFLGPSPDFNFAITDVELVMMKAVEISFETFLVPPGAPLGGRRRWRVGCCPRHESPKQVEKSGHRLRSRCGLKI